MIKNLIIGGLSLIFLAWVMAACSTDSGKKKSNRGKPVIAVSIPPQLFFIDNIAGDKVETLCLIQSNADPESFEPTPTQRVKLADADVYIPLGTLPFEKNLLASLSDEKTGLMINQASEGIEPLKDSHFHSHEHHEGHQHKHDAGHSETDPHIWSSAKNAKIIALNTLNALIAADSVNEDYYRANYARLEARLDSIDNSFEKVFGAMEQKPSFIVWHPSLSYFARDYGLTQIALSDGGKEASVKGVIEKLKKAGSSDAPVCFYQQEFDAGKASVLTSGVDAKIVEINPMNKEWEDEIQKLYDAFTLN